MASGPSAWLAAPNASGITILPTVPLIPNSSYALYLTDKVMNICGKKLEGGLLLKALMSGVDPTTCDSCSLKGLVGFRAA